MAIWTIGWLLSADATRAMATQASAWHYIRVIKLAIEKCTVNGVTGNTITRRIDMRWCDIVTTIARRRMTTRRIAAIGDAGVIKRTGAERLIERVTETTIFTRGDMRRSGVIDLAGRKYTVMARITTLAIYL